MSEPRYKIVRNYRDRRHPDNGMIVKPSVTLEEAEKHCNDPATHEPGVWFDCFYPVKPEPRNPRPSITKALDAFYFYKKFGHQHSKKFVG